MKVQIFTNEDINVVQNEINSYCTNKEIASITITPSVMHDLYSGQQPTVCNQWIQYTAVIITN